MMTRSSIVALAVMTFGLVNCNVAPLLTEELGQRRSAIVNGNTDSGHPYVGVLHSGNISGCTATLIGHRTVLTAAHCVLTENAPYQLLQPVHFYVGGFSGTKYTATSVTTHPSYAGGNKADIAVVRLAYDVAGITPAIIASSAPKATEVVRLVGYGKTSEGGPDDFGTKRVAQNSIGQIFAQYFSVYGASGSLGNLCDGDSGGPTFATRNGKEVLVGVHSTKGGTCGQEGNDMRVDAFHGWIAAEAGGDLYTETTDQAAPTVQFLSPAEHAQLGSSFLVQLAVSDDVGVVRVVLHVNGQVAGERTTAPFTFQLQNLPAGTMTLEAVAYDGAGRTGSSSTQVTVTAGSTAPAQGKVFGAACTGGAECQSSICVAGATAGALFCSKTCAGPADCPTTMECAQNLCRQKGGAQVGDFGGACDGPQDCASGLCALDPTNGQRFCTQGCDANAATSTCPGTSVCYPGAGTGLCGPLLDNNAAPENMLEGGCSVGAGPTSGGLGFVLVLLAGVLVARRRP